MTTPVHRDTRPLRTERRGGVVREVVVTAALVALVVGCGGGTTSPSIDEAPEGSADPATSYAAPAPDPGPCRPATEPGEQPTIVGGGTTAQPTGGPEDAALWAPEVGALLDERYPERSAGAWLDPDSLEVVVLLTAPDPDADPEVDPVAAMPDEDIVADVAEAAADPDAVVCQRARASSAELESLARQAIDGLMPLGVAMGGGPDDRDGVVRIEVEADLDDAVDVLGDLADHPGLVLERPECSIFDPADAPDDGVDLPGNGSNCGGMLAGFEGVLDGDPATGCLFFGADPDLAEDLADDAPPGDEEPILLLWPAGWTITPDGTVHDQHGEPVAAIGDRISGAGGHLGDGPWPEPCSEFTNAASIHGVSRISD